MSVSKRCLQSIHINVAAGHDHNHFFACKIFPDFVSCYQGDGAGGLCQIMRSCQRHSNSFKYLVFGQKYDITDGVLEDGIRQMEYSSCGQSIGNRTGIIKSYNFSLLP